MAKNERAKRHGRQAMPARPHASDPSVPKPPKQRPMVFVLTRDQSLKRLISNICAPSWLVETSPDPSFGHELMLERSVRMLIIDDEVIPAAERGWFCNQINKLAPDAAFVYVASQHSSEIERTARANGAMCYLAQPLDSARLTTMLQAWLKRSADWPAVSSH